MNYETNRLNTFNNWPGSAPVDPIRIAKAGFYYTGEGMEVQCFSCGSKISQWNYGDQVMLRHRRMKPNCTFVVNPLLSGNIPLVLGQDFSSTDSAADSITSQSTFGEGQNESIETPRDYGHTEEDEMYQSDALRLLSFSNWDDASVSREALVSAGFYHAGVGRLRCAWCGGELAPFRDFGSLGPPLEVHRMYFPRCEYVASMEMSQNTNDISPPSTPPLDVPIDAPPIQTQQEAIDNDNPQSSGAAHNAQLVDACGTWRRLGVVGGGAKHPRHALLAARLASFDSWPADRRQDPRALAEAGFFHTGTDDQVRCFYCDGGLGKWEEGDTPWSEHARWFPNCGYVLLVKGQEFISANLNHYPVQRTISAESGLASRRRNTGVTFPITDSQILECMESAVTLGALSAGLDAARVYRALVRRLRATGMPFNSSEALIDAVLNEQLNEEAWSVSPQSQRFARDILAETLREFAPRSGIIPPTQSDERPDSRTSHSDNQTRSPSPEPAPLPNRPEEPDSIQNLARSDNTTNQLDKDCNIEKKDANSLPKKTNQSLEEENRQLKEARLCKVCMDSEVSVVFLPCGHLVSCAGCGAALDACPLCRCAVRALVRAYLA